MVLDYYPQYPESMLGAGASSIKHAGWFDMMLKRLLSYLVMALREFVSQETQDYHYRELSSEDE